MNSVFQEPEMVPSPGFFKDSYQAGISDFFDQSFTDSNAQALQDAFDPKLFQDVSAVPNVLPTEYPFPKMPRTAELTPPSSAKESPLSWPPEELLSDRNSRAALLPTIRTVHVQSATARREFGQVTPPDDDARDKFDFTGAYGASHIPLQQHAQQKLGKEAAEAPEESASVEVLASKRSRASPSKAPKGTKRSRASHRKSDASETTEPEQQQLEEQQQQQPVATEKRSLFLERNRLAAYKCRQKKKEQVKQMEENSRNLQRLKNEKIVELETLKREYFQLKSQILEHVHSGCKTAQKQLDEMWDAEKDEEMTTGKSRSPSVDRSNDDSAKSIRRASVSSSKSSVLSLEEGDKEGEVADADALALDVGEGIGWGLP